MNILDYLKVNGIMNQMRLCIKSIINLLKGSHDEARELVQFSFVGGPVWFPLSHSCAEQVKRQKQGTLIVVASV